MKRIAFVVRGRVQGVWFRASAREAADRHRLTGWVRNRSDGAVDGEAQGDESALSAFCEFLGRGPAHAKVEAVEVEDRGVVDGEAAFRVRRD